MPRVSVIIPNYNHCRFLTRRFDTVLAQTYSDFEVLFLDDASTDTSLAVFAHYSSHPRVRSFLNSTNSGSTFVQWNRGVEEAAGEYIWFAESDDEASPDFLAKTVAVLDAHPNVGLVYTDSTLIDVHGYNVGSTRDWNRELEPTRWENNYIAQGQDECSQYLCIKNPIPNASAVLFRKKLYEEVGKSNTSMRFCGDWDLWVRLLLKSDVAYLAEPLNRYRLTHSSSVRGSDSSKQVFLLERFEILQRIYKECTIDKVTYSKLIARCACEWLDEFDTANRRQRAKLVEVLSEMDSVSPRFAQNVLLEAVERTRDSRRSRVSNWKKWFQNLVVPPHSRRYRWAKQLYRSFRKTG